MVLCQTLLPALSMLLIPNATVNHTLTYIYTNNWYTCDVNDFWWIRCYCCVAISIKYSYLLQIQLLVVVLFTCRSANSWMSVTLEHAQQMLEKGEKIEQEFAEYFTGE